MITEITYSDNCKVQYVVEDIPVRSYRFEYKTFNDIRFDTRYYIYLSNVNFRDVFKVTHFGDEIICFETFNDAVAYIFNETKKLKDKMDTEQIEIQSFINNKKGKNKKNGSTS